MVTAPLQIGDLVNEFSGVAANGPIPALLMVLGTILFVVSMGVFGLLSLGGLLKAVTRP